MEKQGSINQYACRQCGLVITTIVKNDGATPFMISCENEKCDGEMVSQWYQVNQGLVPTHEWYMPDAKEIEAEIKEYVGACIILNKEHGYGDPDNELLELWKNEIVEHHDNGGLSLRRIKNQLLKGNKHV